MNVLIVLTPFYRNIHEIILYKMIIIRINNKLPPIIDPILTSEEEEEEEEELLLFFIFLE